MKPTAAFLATLAAVATAQSIPTPMNEHGAITRNEAPNADQEAANRNLPRAALSRDASNWMWTMVKQTGIEFKYAEAVLEKDCLVRPDVAKAYEYAQQHQFSQESTAELDKLAVECLTPRNPVLALCMDVELSPMECYDRVNSCYDHVRRSVRGYWIWDILEPVRKCVTDREVKTTDGPFFGLAPIQAYKS